jgi:hypothetical protein
MAIQTAVSYSPAVAIEGQIADINNNDMRSYAAGVDITNGRFVVMGAADGRCKLPTATGEITGGKALGISTYEPLKMVSWPAGTTVPYPQGTTVPVIRKGPVWVKVEEAVVPGDPVFVRFAAGAGGTAPGAFRKSADTATAVQYPGAVYLDTAAANGLARVDLNAP